MLLFTNKAKDIKMKKLLSIFLLISLSLTIVSCGKDDDGIPEGMQLVRGGDDVGYYMYAPEEWTVSNQGNISAAYASAVDSSSITYTETDMPNVSVAEYFAQSSQNYTPDMSFKLLTSDSGIATTFGNADNATKFEFEFKHSERSFRSLQILTEYKGRFGIFTFTSPKEHMSSKDVVQYDYYKEKIDKVISSFKYVNKSADTDEPQYEVHDGYKLISDKSVSKFNLYVPENFAVEYSSGIVSALMPDGSSINLSRATQTNVRVDDYLNTRLEELKSIVSDVTVIEYENSDGTKSPFNSNDTLGNARSAASQEYTFVYNGIKYHVYQVCAVTAFNGFVFTYTATEENYLKNLETVKEIAKRVEF